MDRRPPAFAPLALALAACLVLAACSGDDDDADDTLAPVTTTTVVATTAPPTTATPTTEAVTTTTTAAPTTTTAPAPTEPPPTETPTTTSPPPTTSAAPTTTALAAATVSLARDGLGVVPFGTDADATVAALTGALGAPTEDTGWVDPFTISTCPGNELRRVGWGTLAVLLGDPAGTGAGVRQFFGYSYGNVSDVQAQPAGLVTPEGIGLGASVAELRAAYPAVVINAGEEGLIEPSFFVDESLRGIVTGDTDTDSVTVIFGGPFCG